MSILDRKHILTIDLDDSSIDYSKNIKFYNTDKGISNLYVRIRKTDDDGAKNYLNESDLKGLKLNLTVIKPKTNQIRNMVGILTKELTNYTCAIYKFELSNEFTNQIGIICGEFNLTDGVEYVTIDPFSYEIKASKLTELNAEIISNPDLPVLKQLIDDVKSAQQWISNIDDKNVSEVKTYSSKKIDEQFNTKASKEEVEIERNRITNLATLAEGSTTGDAELIDIRVGADGITYNNAGESIRAQIKNVNSRIDSTETINTTQNNRLTNIETKNKIQDIYLGGLFNENNDKRLTVEGEGNNLTLTGSKNGIVTVDKIVGDTFVNLYENKTKTYYRDYIFSLNETVNLNLLKEGGVYTAVIISSTPNFGSFRVSTSDTKYDLCPPTSSIIAKFIYNEPDDTIDKNDIRAYVYPDFGGFVSGDEQKIKVLILEGDYTNKPIPQQVFDGLKSSFENELITQEMVTQGLEKAENLGKYKVMTKVRGKNLFDGEVEEGSFEYDGSMKSPIENEIRNVNPVKVIPGSILTFNALSTFLVWEYNKDMICIEQMPKTVIVNTSLKLRNDTEYINFRVASPDLSQNIQIEEGTVATPYEPYYERSQSVYLTSPLLKGDELVVKDDGLYHYHKMGKVVLNGSESWKKPTDIYNQINTRFSIAIDDMAVEPNEHIPAKVICDRFPIISFNVMYNQDVPGLAIWYEKPRLSIRSYGLTDLDTWKSWLQSNPITLAYQLSQPYYEPIQADKLLLECINDSTLHIDTVIPVESVKANYTGNIPSVYTLQETGEQNTYDIADTQIAVDYLLMSSRELGVMAMSLSTENTNLTKKGMNTMGAYFASRIMKGYLDYQTVVKKYPEFKEDIDFILRSEGREDLIVN